MPYLIRTIDEIFRAERRDLFVIQFKLPDGADLMDITSDPPGQADILHWFIQHLPYTHVEPLGPPEDSGWIIGGIDGTLWVDFDPASLAAFCAAWETPDGASIDPRFQCYLYPLAMYEARHRKE